MPNLMEKRANAFMENWSSCLKLEDETQDLAFYQALVDQFQDFYEFGYNDCLDHNDL